MFDNFLAGSEELHCESIRAWSFPIGHFLECLVDLLLSYGFVQIVILFFSDQSRDMSRYPLYGRRSVLVWFLGYPLEMVY